LIVVEEVTSGEWRVRGQADRLATLGLADALEQQTYPTPRVFCRKSSDFAEKKADIFLGSAKNCKKVQRSAAKRENNGRNLQASLICKSPTLPRFLEICAAKGLTEWGLRNLCRERT
jgi:hypothetical protein